MIIIKTPQPDVEERLVLVPPESCTPVFDDGKPAGLSIRAQGARDATPADLERAGLVLREQAAPGTLAHLRADLRDMTARAEKAELDAAEWAAEVDALRAEALAELADARRERDTLLAELADAKAPAEGEPRVDPGSADHLEAWSAIAAFVESGGGTSTSVATQKAVARIEAAFRKFVALGVAHERARHQPAQDRATDEELFAIADAVYEEAHGGEILNGPHEIARRVAARVRKECLVTRAVAANVDIRVCEDDGGGFMLGVHAPGCDEELARCVPAADVPATLARLLGEVARG